MYGGPIHNPEFIKRVLAQLKDVDRETYPTMDRIEGMLHTALEEITFGAEDKSAKKKETERLDPLIPKADPSVLDHHPFFFTTSSASRIVHCSAPPTAALRGALRHAGFRVTMSHCRPGSIKTDASWRDVWHIMLEWVRQKAPLKNPLKPNSAGHAIMSKGSAQQNAPAKEDQKQGQPAAEASAAEGTASPGEMLDNALNGTGSSTGGTEQAGPGTNGQGRPTYMDVNFEVKFDETLGRDLDRGKYVRYQAAPRENWGPMSRAR